MANATGAETTPLDALDFEHVPACEAASCWGFLLFGRAHYWRVRPCERRAQWSARCPCCGVQCYVCDGHRHAWGGWACGGCGAGLHDDEISWVRL